MMGLIGEGHLVQSGEIGVSLRSSILAVMSKIKALQIRAITMQSGEIEKPVIWCMMGVLAKKVFLTEVRT